MWLVSGGAGREDECFQTVHFQMGERTVRTGIGVMLCVLSPAVLFFLIGIAGSGTLGETLAVAIGLGALMLMVLVAVVIFIYDCSMMSDFEWVLKEDFVLNYGVSGIVEDRMKKQKPMLTMTRAIGVAFNIRSHSSVSFHPLGQ